MTGLQLLLIALGPFLAIAPFVVVAAPQIPGFWGRRPQPAMRVRVVGSFQRAAVAW